ncbi:MAG TPA: glucuronyl hydrolase [Marinilabiliales bacterium]|jgi:hypothetical protein|nr:MAG: glucuronyl hydrolase [Bacteroidetes bacterium GWA2_40_14]OFX56757.1 MAG: glucuronyl hydrolase [Bacteroidetes bacterium GWC2_40_13]OFX72853.1 MAG: glucuronyl hydrolase [Bacteroidetes bacterium GWD2_40_43]OFX93546.1 MAG: glucuronyl hydrolase [Bacteroidetes bacterium GWE2_40_63]OFY18304.1 MAG: glucuronyl hydrolase [Bacteroidetes bacterium GWF2_40_13]OFZ27515.1 MAG: glucuronyl hydrolase [Bacteroidetes bacterium RIFOXYC2_FULL_40_12]HAM99901.1 glucuronyl hydrolase [Marinilabiliales bacteriu
MNVKQLMLVLLLFVFFFSSCKIKTSNDEQLLKTIDQSLQVACEQYRQMQLNVPDSLFPRTYIDGQVKLVSIYDWTSGFYPASLWYLFQYSKDTLFLNNAKKFTSFLEPLKHYKGTHDLGFMIFCPYGNGYKITGDTSYLEVILETSKSLASRFNPKVGLIKSWDHNHWQYPVIIDNMMNLELLCQASKLNNDSMFYHIAATHANITLKNHFRPDNSTFHLVNYDTLTGAVINKQTVQGYSDSSSWARGQSWGLYGFTVMFRETGDSTYLKKACQMADYLIRHPNLPSDAIPYWDYNAPKIPNEPRDVSAAAIMASALIELHEYAPTIAYLEHAKTIIRSLSSANYLAKTGTNGHFILMHATGHLPANSEIDVPINYADYYFIEALLRMRAKLESAS